MKQHVTHIGFVSIEKTPIDTALYKAGFTHQVVGYVVQDRVHLRHHRVLIGVGEGEFQWWRPVRDLKRDGYKVVVCVRWEPQQWKIYEGSTTTWGKLLSLEFWREYRP